MAIAGYALAHLDKLEGDNLRKFLNTARGEGQPGEVRGECLTGRPELACVAVSHAGMGSLKLSWGGWCQAMLSEWL